jgi:hypothetical protein
MIKISEMKKGNYLCILCALLLMSAIEGCVGKYPPYEITDELFLNRTSLHMLVGEQVQVTASPADVPLTWSSDNEEVATVTQTGLITAVSEGLADVYVHHGESRTLVPVNVVIPTIEQIIILIDDTQDGQDSLKQVRIIIQALSEGIVTARIFWNNYSDSIDIDISGGTGTFSQTVDYSGSDYLFSIVSIDRFGNRSRANETVLMLWGNNVANATAHNELLIFDWGNTSYVDHCIISYNSSFGVRETKKIFVRDGKQLFFDYSSDLECSVVFIIPPADTVYGAAFSPKLSVPELSKCDKTWWSVEVSDETASDGGGKDRIIDGSTTTGYWHSQWSPTNAPCPHWAIIDMQEPLIVARTVTARRTNGDTKTVQYFVGDSPDADADTWVKVAEGAYASTGASHTLTLNVTKTVSGRYLKLVLPDSFRNPFTGIVEVDVYEIKQ